MQKLSNVFKEAKKRLWDGHGGAWDNPLLEEYICHAIEATQHYNPVRDKVKNIILYRLGKDRDGYARTVESYLHDVVGVPYSAVHSDNPRVQKYRKDWLTSLEKEFAKIEKLFPAGVHHIDGDVDNWELSNLADTGKSYNFRKI